MDIAGVVAGVFRMDEQSWQRHANPWSVWTRFAALPLMLLAIWSRVWIGWWSLLPVAAVVIWLFVNPVVFPPVEHPRSWAAKGIHGERLWLRHRDRLPPEHRRILRLLVAVGLCGFALIAWGLIALRLWPVVFGTTVLIMAQLWRIDRFGWLWENSTR